MKLLVELGDAASEYQSRTLRNLNSTRVECDEIWAFVHAKQRNVPQEHEGEFGYGDVWTWMAIAPDSKLIPTFLVATRDEFAAQQFIRDLGSRLANRMQIRRFTRLTNAFSKKVRNHAAAVALDTLFYNFARPHKTLANPYPRTPAMAAGIADHIWSCEEIAALLD